MTRAIILLATLLMAAVVYAGGDATLDCRGGVLSCAGEYVWGPQNGATLTWSPTTVSPANASSVGGAPLLLEPTFSADHTAGMYVRPTYDTATMIDPATFYYAHGIKIGYTSVPIPAGTKGNIHGYECNVRSARPEADSSEGIACFAGTIETTAGEPMSGLGITHVLTGVDASITAINANIDTAFSGAAGNHSKFNFYAGSSGAQPATAALYLSNQNYVYGVDLNNNSLVNASNITVQADTGWMTLPVRSATPIASECDAAADEGRVYILDTGGTDQICVCTDNTFKCHNLS